MRRKASVEAQWFIIFGIVLVALTSLALFMRITAIMEDQDFFYEYHSDQLVTIIESMTTTKNPVSLVYSFGELKIVNLALKKQSVDDNAELILEPRGKKELIVPKNDIYNENINDLEDAKLLLSYDKNGFRIIPVYECSDNADISGLRILWHNTTDLGLDNPRISVYAVAVSSDVECRIRNNFQTNYAVLRKESNLYTTIQPNLNLAYEGTYDAIITLFEKK